MADNERRLDDLTLERFHTIAQRCKVSYVGATTKIIGELLQLDVEKSRGCLVRVDHSDVRVPLRERAETVARCMVMQLLPKIEVTTFPKEFFDGR